MIFSGDNVDYLPYSISSIYGKYETLSEEYHVATTSGYRLCEEEDLKTIKENAQSQFDKYREELTKAANEYRERPEPDSLVVPVMKAIKTGMTNCWIKRCTPTRTSLRQPLTGLMVNTER